VSPNAARDGPCREHPMEILVLFLTIAVSAYLVFAIARPEAF
jgi:hypothetical protein